MHHDPHAQSGSGEFLHGVHRLDRVPGIHRGAGLVREQVRAVALGDLHPRTRERGALLLPDAQGREGFVLDLGQFEPIEGAGDQVAIALRSERAERHHLHHGEIERERRTLLEERDPVRPLTQRERRQGTIVETDGS